MLEVEDWTQPSPNKRRGISKKGASEKSDSGTREANFQPSSSPLPLVAPGPPDDEIEDVRAVQSPNSRYFPVRTRANSSPSSRLSLLSRLLAQAPTTADSQPLEEISPPVLSLRDV